MLKVLICLTLIIGVPPLYSKEEDTIIIASYNHQSPSIIEIEKKVAQMYNKAGVKFKIKRFPMARALAEAKAERVDALVGHPEGTQQLVSGFEPVGESLRIQKFAAFSTAKKGMPIKNYRIVVLRGMPYVEHALEKQGIKFITHPDVDMIVELLKKNRYDTTIMSIENAAWGAEKVPGLQQVSDTVAEFSMVHLISSKKTETIKKLKASTQ